MLFRSNGAEIVDMTGTDIPGMYWRFLVADDKGVSTAIIRDTDSRINARDKMVVNEFLESDKVLHVIRDHPHHKYPILGGMWGIKLNTLDTKMETSIRHFLKKVNRPFRRMDDMVFLDLLTKNLMEYSICHDNYYTDKYKNSVKFPDYNGGNEYYHYIGRLDYNSEGLLLLTDSTTYKRKLESPKSNIKRVYVVNVIGSFNDLKLKALNQKIYAAKIYKNPHVSLTHTNKNKHTLRFELTEGKNREIRNICEIFNLKVERLKRISFGQYKVKSIPLSKYKEMTIHESY